MKFSKLKIRRKITDENLENSMRLSISDTKVNIDSLLVQVQGQSSHKIETSFIIQMKYEVATCFNSFNISLFYLIIRSGP
jgi:hypothetical protein